MNRTFLITMVISLALLGLVAMALPVEAQVGFPPTLTPLPTFDGNYGSPAQATLARTMTDTIWWQDAPSNALPNPRPGFVMYVIQWWNWINDTTQRVIMYSILLLVVIFITLRFAHRVKTWGEKSDGASITKNEVTMKLDSRDVENFRRNGR